MAWRAVLQSCSQAVQEYVQLSICQQQSRKQKAESRGCHTVSHPKPPHPASVSPRTRSDIKIHGRGSPLGNSLYLDLYYRQKSDCCRLTFWTAAATLSADAGDLGMLWWTRCAQVCRQHGWRASPTPLSSCGTLHCFPSCCFYGVRTCHLHTHLNSN